jgi:hypothetical protein
MGRSADESRIQNPMLSIKPNTERRFLHGRKSRLSFSCPIPIPKVSLQDF